jgi:predicted RNA binding protein YcfA (HicA-like mRNA interferase family)
MRLVKDLKRQGFQVVRTGSGHWRVTHPDRAGSVVMGFSPNNLGQHKTLKRLRKLGYLP